MKRCLLIYPLAVVVAALDALHEAQGEFVESFRDIVGSE